jgi:abortive infection bacteriophage resistance protein
MTAYTKEALPVPVLLDLMIARGLHVPDRAYAEQHLSFIGYFRLSGYMLPFQLKNVTTSFDFGANFNTILDRYFFDRRLRLLMIDAIERIEVSLRAALTNITAAEHGINWFVDQNLFEPKYLNDEGLGKTWQNVQSAINSARNKSEFIQHFFAGNFSQPEHPPSWMTLEVLEFGPLSRLFSSLILSERKRVAQPFGIDEQVLKTWFHAIAYLRNVCAHHARIYGRTFTIKPKHLQAFKNDFGTPTSVYRNCLVMHRLLKVISPDTKWQDHLSDLFDIHPMVQPSVLGFPDNWRTLPAWTK